MEEASARARARTEPDSCPRVGANCCVVAFSQPSASTDDGEVSVSRKNQGSHKPKYGARELKRMTDELMELSKQDGPPPLSSRGCTWRQGTRSTSTR